MADEMKTYRVTWRHELYIKAKTDEEARDTWEEVSLGHLDNETSRKGIGPHDAVEEVSFECESEDYRQIASRKDMNIAAT